MIISHITFERGKYSTELELKYTIFNKTVFLNVISFHLIFENVTNTDIFNFVCQLIFII